MKRSQTYERGINTRRWRALRRDILTAHPLCERCLEEGLTESATEVHHIRPVDEVYDIGQKLQRLYDPANLRALCHRCHVEVHRQMGKRSAEYVRQRNAEESRGAIGEFFGE